MPLALYLSDGVTLLRGLPARTSLGGSRVTASVSYPEKDGGIWTSWVPYTITVECPVPIVNTGNPLLAWVESLSFEGTGGPRNIHLQPLQGAPQKQQVAEQTPARATQHGSAVGLYDWPYAAMPGPIWPGAEQQDRRKVDPKTPKLSGSGNALVYTEFELAWSYFFEDASPLTGTPNRQQVYAL